MGAAGASGARSAAASGPGSWLPPVIKLGVILRSIATKDRYAPRRRLLGRYRGPSLRSGCRLFIVQQPPFAIDAPPVARQIAVLADHAVAGDDHRDAIRGARTRHRPCRLRI